MSSIKSFFFLLPFISLFFSCASGGREERVRIRAELEKGTYQAARVVLDSSKDYQYEINKPLLLMEKGLLCFEEGDYCSAIEHLSEAKRIARERYTVSTSKQIASFLSNDNDNNYYEIPYERSFIHYYLTLSHYLLSLNGNCPLKVLNQNERRTELFASRAELVDWNAWTKTLKNMNLGESVFKDDLLAKILGGLIHEAFDSSQDHSIALNLYKEAKDLLFKNYNAYKSFNKTSDEFKRNFYKLHKLGIDEVKRSYVSPTLMQTDLNEFLDSKVKSFSQKKKIKSKDITKVNVILERGLIPFKYGKKIEFGVGAEIAAQSAAGTLAAVSFNVLATFAYLELGMPKVQGPISTHDAFFDMATQSIALNGGLLIEFELPKMDEEWTTDSLTLEILDANNILVESKKLVLVSPTSEIAAEAIDRAAMFNYLKTGARVASKYLLAIGAAYASYQAIKDDDNTFFAKNLAILQYMAATRAIASSEIADTRYWSLLPHEIFLTSLNLNSGNYSAQVRIGDKILKLGEFSTSATEQKSSVKTQDLFLRYRIFD